MQRIQRKRLVDLLSIQSKSGKTSRIRAYTRDALVDAGMTVEKRDKQLFARKGRDGPVPYVVAHADTVHDIVKADEYAVGMYTERGAVIYHAYDPKTGKDRGVGGDDKCGLWVAVEAAYALTDVGVIITVDEERGCQGARRIKAAEMEGASVLLQADRRGNDDAVRETWNGTISSPEWQDHVGRYVTAHGYDWYNHGAGTDVAVMGPEAKVCAINVSAGYYDPHTSRESVNEEDAENALELVLALAEQSGAQRWEHERKPRAVASYQGGMTGNEWTGTHTRSYSINRNDEWRDGATWDGVVGMMTKGDEVGVRTEGRYVWLKRAQVLAYRTWLRERTRAYDEDFPRRRECFYRGCGSGAFISWRNVPYPEGGEWERAQMALCRQHAIIADAFLNALSRQQEIRDAVTQSSLIAI